MCKCPSTRHAICGCKLVAYSITIAIRECDYHTLTSFCKYAEFRDELIYQIKEEL